MKRIFISLVLLIMITGNAGADQAAWIPEPDANKAASMINPGTEIRKFCQPCGQTSWTPVNVKKIEVRNTSGDYFQVYINDKGLDLAYTYMNQDGKWRNIAIILGLDVSGVSEYIDGKNADSSGEDTGNIAVIERKISNCLDKDYTTAGMIECMDMAARMWDQELNRVYQLLRKKLNPQAQKSLKVSQRAWIKYRDLEYKNIDSIYSGFQGTMYGPMRLDHSVQLTKQRVSELQSFLDLFNNY